MNVRVRLFAAARQAATVDLLTLDLPRGATIGQLRERLAEHAPPLAGMLPRVLFAIDAEYALDTDEIPPEAEVACIPPVSGG